ncbi:MAG: hypothetical protein MRY72_00660 [Aquisalinus sp.]|nr:hypothetical protein [Aquisalinus sp.]
MTPEQKRLHIIAGTQVAGKKKEPMPEGKGLDLLGFAFIGALLIIMLFAWIAGTTS